MGFMLMFGVIFYVAGVIVAWTQRHSFKTLDFDEMEEKEKKETLKNRRCKEMNPNGFARWRKLEEKFVHT